MEIDKTLTYNVNGKQIRMNFVANDERTWCKYVFSGQAIIDPCDLAFLLYVQATGISRQVGGKLIEYSPKEHIKV